MNKKIAASSPNPFSDSQARNYSDDRVLDEFCPTSQFWSLFNDQHEIILGTRGCGKTIVLKMMRYSMLRRLNDKHAKKLVEEKKYIAFYAPLHLEFIKQLSSPKISDKDKIYWFRFSFNCVLAQSILIELYSLLDDLYPDKLSRVKIEYDLSAIIGDAWGINSGSSIHQLSNLREQVSKLYYNSHPLFSDAKDIPKPFIHSLGSTLTSISTTICEKLTISPTWIICVDEAEFLDESYQRCINTVFRSDSGRIAIKMATLPFHHITVKTLDENIPVIDGQDFNYTILNMKPDSSDFIKVTNSIIKTRFNSDSIEIRKLEDFVETIGKDQYKDYYFNEIINEPCVKEYIASHSDESNNEKVLTKYVDEQILMQLSNRSKEHNSRKSREEIKKSVLDKLAPIYYLREIKKKEKGHYIPGWYAGASMIRRISQGNPRIFIRIMNKLFDASVGQPLPIKLKQQHKTIEAFAKSFCEETETLEKYGHDAKLHLETIAERIAAQTHGKELVQSGLSFSFKSNQNIDPHIDWLQKSVAYSRLTIDIDSLKTGITTRSIFVLSNLYAVKYWLPMRSRVPIKIQLLNSGTDHTKSANTKGTKKTSSVVPGQMSLY